MKSFKRFVVFTLVITAFFSACGKNNGNDMDDDLSADHSQLSYLPQTRTSPEPKKGDHVICPVSGTKFVVTDRTPFSEYNGKKVYLAGEEKKEKFDKDPEGYLLPDVKEILRKEKAMEEGKEDTADSEDSSVSSEDSEM